MLQQTMPTSQCDVVCQHDASTTEHRQIFRRSCSTHCLVCFYVCSCCTQHDADIVDIDQLQSSSHGRRACLTPNELAHGVCWICDPCTGCSLVFDASSNMRFFDFGVRSFYSEPSSRTQIC